jgi:Ca-activated chloride channel family protein
MLSFIWPELLFLLLLIPLAVFYYFRIQRQRQQAAASLGFVQGAGVQKPGLHRHIPAVCFLCAWALLLAALARPQAVLSMPRIEGQVILGFDVSGSMAATDFKPTRMEAAKAAARDFVLRQPRDVQIGVVSFSDNGFVVQAPTNDQSVILASINRLAPQRGTSLGNGILTSLNMIALSNGPGPAPSFYTNLTPMPTATPTAVPQGTFSSATIVLLSDGENNQSPNPLLAAQSAAERGVRIYTIGVGSLGGANLKIEGFTVHTQLDEEMLKQIAQITNGTYYYASSEQDLQKIYDNLSPQWVVKAQKTEITSIFAGAGILILILGGVFSLLWFGRLP